MSIIKIYMEYHFGKRRPVLRYRFNGRDVSVREHDRDTPGPHRQNSLVEFDAELERHNTLEVIQEDKTDNDMLALPDGTWQDHYCQIRDVSVDGIHFEQNVYPNCEFRHRMPQEWLQHMLTQGQQILPLYESSTEIRLNGVWACRFEAPVWRWMIEEINERIR